MLCLWRWRQKSMKELKNLNFFKIEKKRYERKEKETITINFTYLFVFNDVDVCFSIFEFICVGYSRPSGGNLEFSLTIRSLICSFWCSICVNDANWCTAVVGYDDDISVHLSAVSVRTTTRNERQNETKVNE
jgi:hypothetical protein